MKTVTKKQYDALEAFFTKPRITTEDNVRLRMNPHKGADIIKIVDIEGFEFRISRAGGVLWDTKEDKQIGSIGRLHSIWVEPEYQGRGLARYMVVHWFTANTWWTPPSEVVRTAKGKNTYAKAWQIIQPELVIKE